MVRVKEGVQFGVIAPGGFAILAAITGAATRLAMDLTITSGSDGPHSGVDDPHHRGEAYDLRSHDLTAEEKAAVVADVMATLGWERFYGFLEAPGAEGEHIHVQVAKGTTYP